MDGLFKSLFSYPSICIWMSIILSLSGLYASTSAFMVVNRSKLYYIPTINDLTLYPQVHNIFYWFEILSIPFEIIILYFTFNFFFKIFNLKNLKNNLIYKLLLYLFIFCIFLIPISHFLISYLSTKIYFTLNLIFVFFFFIFSTFFHILSDSLFALFNNQMIKISWYSSLILIVFLIIYLLLSIIETFFPSSKIHSIIGLIQIFYFSLIEIKYMFLGFIILGARFVPNKFNLIKKSKQNIFNSYYQEV